MAAKNLDVLHGQLCFINADLLMWTFAVWYSSTKCASSPTCVSASERRRLRGQPTLLDKQQQHSSQLRASLAANSTTHWESESKRESARKYDDSNSSNSDCGCGRDSDSDTDRGRKKAACGRRVPSRGQRHFLYLMHTQRRSLCLIPCNQMTRD